MAYRGLSASILGPTGRDMVRLALWPGADALTSSTSRARSALARPSRTWQHCYAKSPGVYYLDIINLPAPNGHVSAFFVRFRRYIQNVWPLACL